MVSEPVQHDSDARVEALCAALDREYLWARTRTAADGRTPLERCRGGCFECGVTLTKKLATEHNARENAADERRRGEEEYNRDLRLRLRDGLVGRR